jgi:penicillin-binding protein 1A
MAAGLVQRILLDRGVRRGLAIAAGLAIVVATSWVGLHLALNRDAFALAVRSRLKEQLETTRIRAFEIGPHFEFSWKGELWIGPLTIDPGPGRPTVQIEWLGARPSISQLLLGRVRPGRIDLVGVKIASDRHGKRLIELWKELRGAPGEARAAAPHRRTIAASISIRDLWLWLEPAAEGEKEEALGPFFVRADGERGDAGWSGSGDIVLPGRGVLHANASLSAKDGLLARGTARQVSMVPWGVLARSMAVDDGTLSGDLAVSGAPGLSRIDAKVSVRIDHLIVAGERLATEPLGPAQMSLSGGIEIDPAARHLETRQMQVLLGPQSVPVVVEVKLDFADEPSFEASTHVGPVSLQKLIAAFPPQVAPAKDAPHLDGPIALGFECRGPLARPPDWQLRLDLDTSALVKEARKAPFLLRGGFDYLPGEAVGGRKIAIDGTNPNFVPLSQLPPILGQAVITSEDSAFYTHHGFDLEGLQNGLTSAIEGGRMRGGSTLTQQLVKNVYLSPERTYARKASEALLTMQVEAALPKSRILELYLNIIEWGPNLYGAGEAARYYFGVDARALTPKQAVFLASIIPNPSRWGPSFRSHGLTDVWQQRLRTLLGTLREREFLTEVAYQAALQEELRFRADGDKPRAISRVP